MDWKHVLADESERLAVASRTVLAAPVPSCPGWSVADLVYHVGEVHHFWGRIVDERRSTYEGIEAPPRPPDNEIVEWFRDGATRTLVVLDATDPATPVWTWAPQNDVAFVRRRMAHETAVHRWDAEAAAGHPWPVATEVASDGIDEMLTMFLPASPRAMEGPDRSVHLHQTDGEGEWVVRFGAGGPAVERAHGKADTALRGPGSDLLLWLWGRAGAEGLEVFGDVATAEALRSAISRE